MGTEQRDMALGLIERMVAAYSARNVDGLLACFATEGAKLRDDAWGELHEGPDAIAQHYRGEFQASPDIEASILGRYASVVSAGESGAEPVVAELLVRGTHLGPWRGLPATGARFEIRVVTFSRFTPRGDRILENRLLYDRATVMRQLGVMHDPASLVGRAVTMLTHPVTMAKAAQRRISARPPAPRA